MRLFQRSPKARRPAPIPFAPFHPTPIDDPTRTLSRTQESPTVRAIMQVLEEHLVDAVDAVADERASATPGATERRAGGLATLLDAYQDLADLAHGRPRQWKRPEVKASDED